MHVLKSIQIDVYIEMRSKEKRRRNCLISKEDFVKEIWHVKILEKNNCNELVKFVS